MSLTLIVWHSLIHTHALWLAQLTFEHSTHSQTHTNKHTGTYTHILPNVCTRPHMHTHTHTKGFGMYFSCFSYTQLTPDLISESRVVVSCTSARDFSYYHSGSTQGNSPYSSAMSVTLSPITASLVAPGNPSATHSLWRPYASPTSGKWTSQLMRLGGLLSIQAVFVPSISNTCA